MYAIRSYYEWLLTLCGLIRDSGLDIRWGCNSRVDTMDDERVRQSLARLLVEQLGYAKEELEPRLSIVSDYANRVVTIIELTVSIAGNRLFIVRYVV